MTQALRSQTIVESILRAWNFETESGPKNELCSVSKTKVHNSITMGLVDSATKQWVHMVCGLWTPETRCPNVDTMSAFDVSGVPVPTADMVSIDNNKWTQNRYMNSDIGCVTDVKHLES